MGFVQKFLSLLTFNLQFLLKQSCVICFTKFAQEVIVQY